MESIHPKPFLIGLYSKFWVMALISALAFFKVWYYIPAVVVTVAYEIVLYKLLKSLGPDPKREYRNAFYIWMALTALVLILFSVLPYVWS